MPEVVTNRRLSERSQPDDGPAHELTHLTQMKSHVAAASAVVALREFPLRRVLGCEGRFVTDGPWVCFRGPAPASTAAYYLTVLYLRGLIAGTEETQ